MINLYRAFIDTGYVRTTERVPKHLRCEWTYGQACRNERTYDRQYWGMWVCETHKTAVEATWCHVPGCESARQEWSDWLWTSQSDYCVYHINEGIRMALGG